MNTISSDIILNKDNTVKKYIIEYNINPFISNINNITNDSHICKNDINTTMNHINISDNIFIHSHPLLNLNYII